MIFVSYFTDLISTESSNINQQREYRLKSIVFHHGVNSSVGHYTADVNVKTIHNGAHRQKWFHCHDNKVDWVSDEEVLNRGKQSENTGVVPYIFFYVRDDASQ